MRRLGDNNLDMPYEDGPDGQDMPMPDGPIAGGLVVLAAVVDVPDIGNMPALIFRFANPDGSGFYPATTLVCDDSQMAKIGDLVGAAATAAMRVAGERG